MSNKYLLHHHNTGEMQRFMEEVKSLGYKDKPPYEKLRSILRDGLKAIKAKDDGKLEFTAVNGAVSLPVKVSTHTLLDFLRVKQGGFSSVKLLLGSGQTHSVGHMVRLTGF